MEKISRFIYRCRTLPPDVLLKTIATVTKGKIYGYWNSVIDVMKLCWVLINRTNKTTMTQQDRPMTIAFMKNFARYRIHKLALALKKTGKYKLVLITQTCIPELQSDIFDEIFFYKSKYGIISILNSLNADVIHALAPPNEEVKTVIEHANCPVVYDAYDVTSIRYRPEQIKTRELKDEKFCFEHASGICLKTQPMIEIMKNKYKVTCPTLAFPDYCYEEFIVESPLPKLSDQDGEIHIVYTGGVAPMNLPESEYGYIQFVNVGKILAAQKIHFHIYPAPHPNSDWTYPHYYKLANQNPYFHMHETLAADKFTKEISKYDYGWWLHLHPSNTLVSESQILASMGNKFFSYLEAGLSIIVGEHQKHAADLVREYDVGIVCNGPDPLDNLSLQLKQVDYEKLIENVFKTRKILSLGENIQKLESFYETVMGEIHQKKDVTSKLTRGEDKCTRTR